MNTPAPPAALPRGKLGRRAWRELSEAMGGASQAARTAPARAGARVMRALNLLGVLDPARLLRLTRKAPRLGPGAAFLAEAEALLTARTRGWEAAAPLFAARATPGAAKSLLRHRADPAIWPALPAPDRESFLSEAEARRFVVYTAVFGATPPPIPRFQAGPGPRFLLLTDRADLAVAGWETHLLAPPVPPAEAEAWARIHPEAALRDAAPEAEASLYLRPDRVLLGNIHTMALRWLLPADFVLWRAGGDWHDIVERHLVAAPRPGTPAAEVSGAAVLAQARDCIARGIPRDQGTFDTGMIWRRHAAPEVRTAMAAWWEVRSATPGLDTISLAAALRDPAHPWNAPPDPRIAPLPGTTPPDIPAAERAPGPARVLPAALGPASYNAFVARAWPKPPLRPRAATLPVAGKPLGVAFLYAEKYAQSASTILRGKQLSEMVAARYPDAIDMIYTSDTAALRDRVVIVTKGALETHSAEALGDLRRRNLAVIGSWDDKRPEPGKIAATDAVMGVSNRQTHDFGKLFPGIATYHVTHHVNSEIRPSIPPWDRPRTAYFGYYANTILPESLRHLVDKVPLETASVEMGWIELLPRYNCHWIVRRSKANDGWKPFLKGFTAARAGAILVVGRDDEDALQYLGDDYPFYTRGTSVAQLEYDMACVAAAFGGPDWARARDIMAQVADRSSDAQVCAEFRAMVEDVIS
jgi:hypothetical protein